MSKLWEKVKVHLQTLIEDEGQREVHQIRGEGEILTRDSITALRFTEKTEDEGEVQHFFTLSPERVNIKRTGQLESTQQFQLHKRTENKIELPQGNILIDIFTEKIDHENDPETRTGKLSIVYQAVLNGQIKRKHELTLHYTKEDVE